MKSLISLSNNKDTNLINLLSKTTNYNLISLSIKTNYNLELNNIPNNYVLIYNKFINDLNNKTSILINNEKSYLSEYIFTNIIKDLRTKGYKFTSINMVNDSKISLSTTINTILKLNPNISILKLLINILKFIVILIYQLINNLNNRNNKSQKLIINPNNINLSNYLNNLDNYKIINKIKVEKLITYQDITFIEHLYNPNNYSYYLKVKKFCKDNRLNLNIVKI